MGAITGTLVTTKGSAFAGEGEKLIEITCVPASASDTITLTQATHGISNILAVYPFLTAGIDAAMSFATATASGLVITLVTLEADGTAATDWTGATAKLLVLGTM